MSWHIEADRGVIHDLKVEYPQLRDAQAQVASILCNQERLGRRYEFNSSGGVVVYDGRQYFDTLVILDEREQVAPLGL